MGSGSHVTMSLLHEAEIDEEIEWMDPSLPILDRRHRSLLS